MALSGDRGPMMAMIGGSAGGGGIDGGGFAPDTGPPYGDGQSDGGPAISSPDVGFGNSDT